MKHFLHIALISLLFITTGKGYGQSVMTSTDGFSNLSNSFSSMDLSMSQLKAFSGRAEQKLKDLEGYLSILSNPEYDQVFRKKAEDLVRSTFHEGDLVLEHPFSRSSIGLSSFINFFSTADEDLFFQPGFAEIDLGELPYWHDEEYYAGEMVFQFTLKRIDPNERSPETKALWYKIGYRIERKMKQFGDHQKAVWEVRLGSMEKN